MTLRAHIEGDVIDQRVFRTALGHYASGVTVIAGLCAGSPVGFTCQSFYSVSVDPPLVSFSVMRTSTTYPLIFESRSFSVNVLSGAQQQLSQQFARSGTDKWAGVGWTPSAGGNPVIDDVLLWLDCELTAEHEAGDHLIVVGRVRELGGIMTACETPVRDVQPLVFYRGEYRRLRP